MRDEAINNDAMIEKPPRNYAGALILVFILIIGGKFVSRIIENKFSTPETVEEAPINASFFIGKQADPETCDTLRRYLSTPTTESEPPLASLIRTCAETNSVQ